ncbi:MAG: hypothetical protein GY704_10045 [Phycisphaeraceae bacterium]|nr:hypothetical protein [Phycisphaeraceae bacterium]
MGLVIVALFALAGTWFYAKSTSPEGVLALRNPIERGSVINADDLQVVQISTDDSLNVLGRDDASVIVGQIALNDLSVGTLITVDHVAATAAIEPGDGVVGLALDPGEYPTLSLRPGDIVRVVEVPGPSESADPEVVLAAQAEIVDVATIGVQNQLFVSLSVDTSEADAIARSGARDRVRLVQVAGT